MHNWFFAHRRQMILALTSGILLTLSFPNVDLSGLAWVAMVPLILALREVHRGSGFWIGFTTGMAHFVTLVYWTVHTMNTYGHLPWYQCIFLLILLAAYLSLYPALFGVAVTRLCNRPGSLILTAPAVWTALEFLRTWLFTGFPWELLGYSQYNHPWIIQVADLWGVYGLSTLIMWVNATIALVLLKWLDKPWRAHRISSRTTWIAAASAATMLILTIGYGIYRVGTTDKSAAKAPQAKIAVIQGNIDQAVKWDPKFQILTTAMYRKLSLRAAADNIDLVIWPETATPFYFLHDMQLSAMVTQTIEATGAYFIVGSPSFSTHPKGLDYHNSAFMVTPEGKSNGKYDKVHLVPFGEYVPLKRWLPFIKKMVSQVGDFKSGAPGSTLAWQNHRVGVLICYEAIFPSLARTMVQNGAHLLVNITNDAWFGHTSAAFQHYSMAVFRAVENKRWLARAANTGISGFIDPCGRIVKATPLYEKAVATAQVALLEQKSYYSQWGDWPLALLTFGFPMVIIGRRWAQGPGRQKSAG